MLRLLAIRLVGTGIGCGGLATAAELVLIALLLLLLSVPVLSVLEPVAAAAASAAAGIVMVAVTGDGDPSGPPHSGSERESTVETVVADAAVIGDELAVTVTAGGTVVAEGVDGVGGMGVTVMKLR